MPTSDTALISNADFIGELIRVKDKLPTITTNKKETFFNIPAGFDIETSSFYVNGEKTAIMYEWTFGIGYVENGQFSQLITYGRTWDQLDTLLACIAGVLDLRERKRLVVYVHNLPYEWQFIRNRFSWTKVFFMDERKPVYAITSDCIEFRCSLKLSGKSLANTAKDLLTYKTEKMVGDLDYTLIRHSGTPLTDQELKYCEHDIKVILCYIQEKIEQDGNIGQIPLTKTGYVRRYCKRAMFPEVEENFDAYEDVKTEAVGVCRTERMLSRRLYPRECPPGELDSQRGWLLRLYQFIPGLHGGV